MGLNTFTFIQRKAVALLYSMKKLLSFVAFTAVRFAYCATMIFCFSSYAGAQEMSIRVYTAKDGLPSNYIIRAYQDKLGYLWISSTEGACRFDGKSFTKDGLTDQLNDGRSAMGFVEYSRNKFISYPNPDSGSIRWNFRILETSAGLIWSITNAGVYQLDNNKWVKIKFYPGYDDHPCRNIIETRDGLYINYGDLLVLRKPDNTYKIVGTFKAPAYYYNAMNEWAGQIFISTLDGIYELINEQLVKLPGPLGRLKGLYVYYRDSKKRFWVDSFPTGLHLIPYGDTTNFISVYKTTTGPIINDITEDDQGNIWL